MRRKLQNRILTYLGLLLIAAALSLTARNFWDSYHAGVEASEAVQKINTLRPSQTETDRTDPIPEEAETPAYILNPEMEMPVLEVDGYNYIGTVDIPALGLSLPVMSEWSYPNLRLSPCRFSGSAYLDDLIIAAHNYSQHFGGLKNLCVGDNVAFTDAEGNVFRYTVSELETVGGNDLEALESSDWDLTLFTCTIGGVDRVTVRCNRFTED